MSPRMKVALKRLVGRDCHKCRAVVISVSAKYGGVYEDRCSLGRYRERCTRRIYTYAELMTANNTICVKSVGEAKP